MQGEGLFFFLLSWEENFGLYIPSCGSIRALEGHAGWVWTAGTGTAI